MKPMLGTVTDPHCTEPIGDRGTGSGLFVHSHLPAILSQKLFEGVLVMTLMVTVEDLGGT